MVGVLAFASDVRAFLPPRKGSEHLRLLTESLYRAEAALEESDYGRAYDFAFARSSRRSLVVLFTDLVDPDASSTLLAAHAGAAPPAPARGGLAPRRGPPVRRHRRAHHRAGRLRAPGRLAPRGGLPAHRPHPPRCRCTRGARSGEGLRCRRRQQLPAREGARTALAAAVKSPRARPVAHTLARRRSRRKSVPIAPEPIFRPRRGPPLHLHRTSQNGPSFVLHACASTFRYVRTETGSCRRSRGISGSCGWRWMRRRRCRGRRSARALSSRVGH